MRVIGLLKSSICCERLANRQRGPVPTDRPLNSTVPGETASAVRSGRHALKQYNCTIVFLQGHDFFDEMQHK
jgi:hypothetical protein